MIKQIETIGRLERELKLLDIIFQFSQDRIALIDENFKILKINNVFAKRFRKNTAVLIGRNYFELCPACPQKILHTVLKSKKPITWFSQPESKKRSGPNTKYCDWRAVPILGKNKQVAMVLLTIRDTTIQQQALEEIISLSKFPAENPNPVLRVNFQGKILYNNMTVYEIAKRHDSENDLKRILPKRMLKNVQTAIKENQPMNNLEIKIDKRVYSYDIMPVCAQGYVNVYGRDITEIKNTQEALKKTEQDVLAQQKNLREKNIALSIVLEQIQNEKEIIKTDIANNIQHVIYPIWEKLKYEISDNPYIPLMDKALKDISSPYSSFLIDSEAALSGREVEICNMVKAGFSSKEISKVLHISVQTVEKHRAHIRIKLKINNKHQNLSTYLQSRKPKDK